MKTYYLAAAFVMLTSPLWALDNGAVTVTPVTTTTTTSSGQRITLSHDGTRVTVSIYTIQPGAALPEHKHEHPRYGFMEAGSLRVTNLETGVTDVFKAGDFIVEAIGQWHKAENAGPELVRLLVIDQTDATVANTGNVVAR